MGGASGDGKRRPRACAYPSVFYFSLHRFAILPQWVVRHRIRGEDFGVRAFTRGFTRGFTGALAGIGQFRASPVAPVAHGNGRRAEVTIEVKAKTQSLHPQWADSQRVVRGG